MKLQGAQVLIECLREQCVDTIFGFPGGTVLPIYDELYDTKDIKHILTAHEQGAVHAADGYARATGKVGVVLVTSGPGAANTVTGIATAYRDSVPVVVISGQVARSLIGKAAFQELSITEITRPITKKNYIVKEARLLPEIIREAFNTARSGRPGPVLIDLPKDVQTEELEYTPDNIDVSYKAEAVVHYEPEYAATIEKSLERAVREIDECSRPVIFAGGGVRISNAHKELREFAEKIKAPVACSLMGTGAIPGKHPYFMGMVGMHGSRCSNLAFTNCDLLIAIGTRFNDRVVCKSDGFAPYARVIHIDIDPGELGKNINVNIPLCGDVKAILKKLIERVKERQEGMWNRQISQWKKTYKLQYKSNGELCPQYFLNKLNELAGDDAIITTEVGQNQMWTAQFYSFSEPGTFISSGGLGTMGFGLGAAIGAAIGKPGRRIINIAGDGSFKMNLIELATVSRYQVPVIQIVMNNNALGMVRQWQKIFYVERYSHTNLGTEVDFVKVAEAYGIKALTISSNEEAEGVLKEALASGGPVLIECRIHPDDLVLPMVPAGEPISECIDDI